MNKKLILTLLAASVAGCGGSGSDSGSEVADNKKPDETNLKTVEIKLNKTDYFQFPFVAINYDEQENATVLGLTKDGEYQDIRFDYHLLDADTGLSPKTTCDIYDTDFYRFYNSAQIGDLIFTNMRLRTLEYSDDVCQYGEEKKTLAVFSVTGELLHQFEGIQLLDGKISVSAPYTPYNATEHIVLFTGTEFYSVIDNRNSTGDIELELIRGGLPEGSTGGQQRTFSINDEYLAFKSGSKLVFEHRETGIVPSHHRSSSLSLSVPFNHDDNNNMLTNDASIGSYLYTYSGNKEEAKLIYLDKWSSKVSGYIIDVVDSGWANQMIAEDCAIYTFYGDSVSKQYYGLHHNFNYPVFINSQSDKYTICASNSSVRLIDKTDFSVKDIYHGEYLQERPEISASGFIVYESEEYRYGETNMLLVDLNNPTETIRLEDFDHAGREVGFIVPTI